MKKYGFLSFLTTAILFGCACSVTVSANSSWVWVSKTRPFDILPLVIIITLITETVTINSLPKIHKPKKVFKFVALANLCSFAAPYLIENFIRLEEQLYTFGQMLESRPIYTVGGYYLFLTILIEIPIIYITFRKETENKKLLFLSILLSNTITTVLTLIIERLFCEGHW